VLKDTIILGIDPGLQKTGWGVIKQSNNSFTFLSCGVIKSETVVRVRGGVLYDLPTPKRSRPGFAQAGDLAGGIVRSAIGGSVPPDKIPLASRILQISNELGSIIAKYQPTESAVEETFVNVNGQSTLKLGQARGAIMLTLAQAGLPISEYAATLVKKSIVGAGRADKNQISQMVQMILPGCGKHGEDAMDALAVAICHAHHRKNY